MADTVTRIETEAFALSGWFALLIDLVVVAGIGFNFVLPMIAHGTMPSFAIVPFLLFLVLTSGGFVVIQPNEALALVFFGKYSGSVHRDGFWWVNPFTVKRRISLRVRNWNTPVIKVNDLSGNPIEVAAVISWQVDDTARALFEIEDYEQFLQIQSEAALRQLAGSRPYDTDRHEDSLRGNMDQVARELRQAIQTHVGIAGIEVAEAKIAHLAYAPEIAGAMLRRQQAEAVISARQKIVEGAVTMVKGALERLEQDGVVQMDGAEKTRLVGNLLTVLVSETQAQPVIQMSEVRA